jgi:hypothetical protein
MTVGGKKKPCGPCAQAAAAIASTIPESEGGTMSVAGAPSEGDWRVYSGELPESIRGLGEIPVHFGSGWWVRLGSAVMVATTPPANLFPPGHWIGMGRLPEGLVFPTSTVKHVGHYVVRLSSNGQYLHISDDEKFPAKQWFFKKQATLTLHLRGARRLGAAGDMQTTGAAVVAYFTSNGCTQSSVPAVVDFQNAWNAANPDDTLTVDGEYGPLTQGALQNALGLNAVPANCFGGSVVIPPPGVNPSPTPVIPNGTSASSGTGPLPYIIGAVVVAGALAMYTYSRKGK